MGCEQIREALSARMDGEPLPAPVRDEDLGTHLDGCADCRAWFDTAAVVTRRTGLGPVPDLRLTDSAIAAIVATTPTAWRARLARGLRRSLLAVGLLQTGFGLLQIGAAGAQRLSHQHDPARGITHHLWHESAAWNIAIGAAVVWMAYRRNRPATLLPIMTVFIVVLTPLTVVDAVAGRVEPPRVWSHSLVVVAYLLLVLLSLRPFHGLEPPRTATTDTDGATLAPARPAQYVHDREPGSATDGDRHSA